MVYQRENRTAPGHWVQSVSSVAPGTEHMLSVRGYFWSPRTHRGHLKRSSDLATQLGGGKGKTKTQVCLRGQRKSQAAVSCPCARGPSPSFLLLPPGPSCPSLCGHCRGQGGKGLCVLLGGAEKLGSDTLSSSPLLFFFLSWLGMPRYVSSK